MTRLNLLRLNTMPAFDLEILAFLAAWWSGFGKLLVQQGVFLCLVVVDGRRTLARGVSGT